MKRILVFSVIASFAFSSVGSAMAAPKPPKSICLHWAPTLAFAVIYTKPAGGKVNTLSGPTKLYEIHGEVVGPGIGMPVSGAGHMLGTTFHFHLTGGTTGPTVNIYTYTFEGLFDVATGTGTGRYVYYGPLIAGGQVGPTVLTPVNCATTVVPYDRSGTGEGVSGDLFAP
jgi:hypothetical protein